MSKKEPVAPKLFQNIMETGCGFDSLEQNVNELQTFRSANSAESALLDGLLLQEIGRVRYSLRNLSASQDEIRDIIESLTAPPYYPATFISTNLSGTTSVATVRLGNQLRVVNFGQTNAKDFELGDPVLLSCNKNVIVGKAAPIFTSGNTSTFMRLASDNRLVIKSRDEEFVVLATAALLDQKLKAGDLVRFDPNALVAYEKIERTVNREYFLEGTPSETFASVGGLDNQIRDLKQVIELHFRHGETVAKYNLSRKKSVLLYGPPGNGKTLIARCLANWMASLTEKGESRFINVKPAGLHSMWYGQTESNYREVFAAAREAGAENPDIPVVIFFDEVDSVGGDRGRSYYQIDDRVATAFMSELNGLQDRGNVLVVTATNRPESLDAAMIRPGRLGDLKLRIPRPGEEAVRQIFEKHLPDHIPYAVNNGGSAAMVRRVSIEQAVMEIFSGNGEVARITFNNGEESSVRACDLINGSGIASIAQNAAELACVREVGGGYSGIGMEDMQSAVSSYLESVAFALTAQNCHKYLDEIPSDVEVVRVDHIKRGQSHRAGTVQ